MSIADSDYNEHMAPILAEGFALNPPAFNHLAGWNYILIQILHRGFLFEGASRV